MSKKVEKLLMVESSLLASKANNLCTHVEEPLKRTVELLPFLPHQRPLRRQPHLQTSRVLLHLDPSYQTSLRFVDLKLSVNCSPLTPASNSQHSSCLDPPPHTHTGFSHSHQPGEGRGGLQGAVRSHLPSPLTHNWTGNSPSKPLPDRRRRHSRQNLQMD